MAGTEYQYIISGLDRSGFDVIGLGAWDAALGLDIVKKVAAGAATDIVCANIEGFVPYLRINKAEGKLKVLITSVMDPQLVKLFELKDVVAEDPIKVIRNLQKNIKHDIFILILHAQGERIQELLAECSGIDLVIDGETGKIEKETKLIHGKALVRNNYGGKYVGYVDLQKDAENKSKFKVSQPALTRVSAKEVAENPEITILVSQYEEERRIFIERERMRRMQKASKHQKPKELYLGSSWCGSCHSAIEKNWQESRHAHAIASLERKGRANDPECLVCHVTGLGDGEAFGGFVDMEVNARMAGVQCEACHGPGGKHAQSPYQIKLQPVTELKCLSCHNQETDPDFTFQNGFSIVDHGKDVKPGQ